MKRCSYCGKEYPDNTTVCAIDGQAVINPTENKIITTTFTAVNVAATKSFDVNLVSPLSQHGTYRVFIERNDLIFIRIKDTTLPMLDIIAQFLGPVGFLIPLANQLLTRRKAKQRLQNIEQQKLEDLLREDGNNFKLYAAEIRDASIDPPGGLSIMGKAGRLILVVRHGEKRKFEFSNDDEMKKAINLLTELLNATLRVNVEWDAGKRRFAKRKVS